MNYGNRQLLLPLVLLLGIFSILIFKSISLAQTSEVGNYDVTVSPVFFDFSVNPGDTISNRIRIRNNTTNPIPLKINIKSLSGDINGDVTLKNENSDNSLSWIKFTEKTFTAKPLEWVDLPFKINVSKDAAYGYYYAVTLEQDQSSPLAKTGAKISGAAAVPILLNVKRAGAQTQGKIASFKSDSGFYDFPPFKLTTDFQNTGNVHVRPHGNIFIKDFLGRQVAILAINDTQSAVLPNSRKIFESEWNDSFITLEPKMEDGQVKLDKNGEIEKSLKIRFDKILDLRIGKYTATEILVISTSSKDIPFEAQTSFFVFPWQVVIVAILFLIFAGVGFFNTLKNIIRKILKIFKR